MPNKSAKDKKRKRIIKNKKLSKEGRTARQCEKYREKLRNSNERGR